MIDRVHQPDSFPRRLLLGAMIFCAAVALAVGAKLCLEFGLAWQCPVISLFGLPCPSCGSTRAFAALAKFDFLTAVKFNPLMVLGLLLFPFFGSMKYLPPAWQRHGWAIFGAVVLLNWVYLLLFLPR